MQQRVHLPLMGKHVVLLGLHSFSYWDRLDGGSIIVACSGGPDSTALACAVTEFVLDPANSLYWKDSVPEVVLWHLDHMLRETSARDAQFVRQLGEKIGARVIIEREDIRTLARERKMNIEAMARERRYALLNARCESLKRQSSSGVGVYAFTAHHMNDQAETVLMRMLRGAHAKGLTGIAQQYGEYVFRPWLSVRREDILDYLASISQDYVLDETNEDISRKRNLIRHRVLPLLETISAQAVKRLANVSIIAERAEAFADLVLEQMHITRLDQAALAQSLPLAAQPWGRYSAHIAAYPWRECAALPDYVSRELTRQGVSIASRQICDMQALYLGLPEPVYIGNWSVRLLDALCLSLAEPVGTGGSIEPVTLREGHWIATELAELRVDKAPSSPQSNGKQKHGAQGLTDMRTWPSMLAALYTRPPADAEWSCLLTRQARQPLSVRTWRPGDRIKLAGGGAKKLSDVFIDAKIPPAFRHVWLILVDAKDEVLWVPGLADSNWMALGNGETPTHQVRIAAKPPHDAMSNALRAHCLTNASCADIGSDEDEASPNDRI